MFKFLNNLFDENKKTLDKYQKIVDQINALEPKIKKLSDKKLAEQTQKFKKIIKNKTASGVAEQEILNQILPEAFATVREVSKRILGLRHYDVQLIAGMALHHGMVTEQRTGEGKTLTVTCPVYLNALFEKGVHVITVNDYLAEVGTGWVGPIYEFLGLKTAVIVHDQARLFDSQTNSEERGDERLEHFKNISRKEAYLADITYGTNNEFGFDYLRDNMAQSLTQMVQRTKHAHHFAIVDECDSILIDEARTPLIISAPDSDATSKYLDYARMVQTLTLDVDYKLDEKAKTATLTDLGIKRIEQKLGVKNLYEESFDTIHHVEAALKAKSLYQRDKEYIVREKQVIIVDDHTGRLMYGRRYSDGLHQAIEAKEGVNIQQESRTLATVSIQNYFRLYKKLAGMTGTAATEREEFKKIYDMDVLVVPTHKPVIREDKADIVYKTTAAKYSAITREVEHLHQQGRPILIGTKSIEHNQIIANFLKRKKIPHQLLNAKNHEKEAFIIADAGKKGAITVATNIAGRGVDIVLGGAKPELKDFRLKSGKYSHSKYDKALAAWQKKHNQVVKLGGLHILGTERHESRRIDNQLRGRSGRQGDPGSSQFFLSLEDDIMRIFGGEQIKKVMDMLRIEEDQPIEHGMISNAIQSAQVKVEGFFFDQRKRLVDFDDVMNKHREIIYKRRRRLLDLGESEQSNDSLRSQIFKYLETEINKITSLYAPEGESGYDELVKEFAKIIPFDQNSQRALAQNLAKLNKEDLSAELFKITKQTYQTREKTYGPEIIRNIEKYVTLSTLDQKWMEHLDNMESLKEGIWLRGDKQTVLSEYKKEAFNMFEGLVDNIDSTIALRIFRIQPQNQQPIIVRPQNIHTHKDDINESLQKEVADASVPTAKSSLAPTSTQGSMADLAAALKSAKTGKRSTPGIKRAKIKRNDPCPCGSGLKWKKCGLINAPEHKA